MTKRKVVVIAFHDDLESALPPLNISVGASASGAEVLLAFSKDGTNLIKKGFHPAPSRGKEYLSAKLQKFDAPTFESLMEIARESGVRMVVTERVNEPSDWPIEYHSIKWVLNEAATADLFVHF